MARRPQRSRACRCQGRPWQVEGRSPLGSTAGRRARLGHRRFRLALRRPRREGTGRANQRGSLGVEAAEGSPATPTRKFVKWDIDNAWNLPGARDDAAGWTANGTIYNLGGKDGQGDGASCIGRSPAMTGRSPSGSTSTPAMPYGSREVRLRDRLECGHRRRRLRPGRARDQPYNMVRRAEPGTSSSASSARPCPASRSTGRSVSSWATSTRPAPGR